MFYVCSLRYLISPLFPGGTVVTWSKDGQVLSADNVKVLNDNRIHLEHQPKRGVNISIDNLRGEDSGLYKCSLNFNKKALHVEHKLQVQGEKNPKDKKVCFSFSCSNHPLPSTREYNCCPKWVGYSPRVSCKWAPQTCDKMGQAGKCYLRTARK